MRERTSLHNLFHRSTREKKTKKQEENQEQGHEREKRSHQKETRNSYSVKGMES